MIQKEYLNISKVATYISSNQGLINYDETSNVSLQLTTIPKKNIFVTVNLYADKNLCISNPNITQYDLAVMDSAYTLFTSGVPAFTPEMIVRTMSGNMNQTVSPQMSGAVTKSLNKLKFIRIKIDCTDEMIARKKIKKGQTAHLEDYLMPLKELEVKVGNQQIMHGYQFTACPVLYSYASSINQIINVPRTILETNEFLNDTDEVVVIKRYLIKRIETMKNKKNNIVSNRISYFWFDQNAKTTKGMFKDLDYKSEDISNWRKKKSDIHRKVMTILNVFKKESYIKDFSEIREGKSINGVEIMLF